MLVEYAWNNTSKEGPFEIVERGRKVSTILHTKAKTFEAQKYVQDATEA